MSSRARRGTVIVAALVVLLILAALATPFLIPVEAYRPLVVWAIRSGTGRDVRIDKLTLSLFPSLRMRLAGVHLQNPPGFPAGDALDADTVDLVVDARALLSRRLDVTQIVPSGVQIHVLRNAAGRTNFSPAAPAVAPGERPAVAKAAPALTFERIAAVTVKPVAITFADAPGRGAPAPSFALTGASGTIGAIDPQARDWAKNLDIQLELHGAQLTTSLLAEPVAFQSGELGYASGNIRGTFAATLGDVQLSGDAAVASLDPFAIRFAVRSPAVDLAALPKLLRGGASAPPPAGQAHRVLAHGTIAVDRVRFAPLDAQRLAGQLDLYPDAVQLTGLTAAVFGGSVRGTTTITESAGIPTVVSAQLHGIDLQSALVALGVGAKITGTLDARIDRLTTRLAQNPLATLAASGSFVISNGTMPGLNLQGEMAQAITTLGITAPSGGTRFSYLGGDLRIAGERASSSRLRLVASGMQATLHGSFGFDRTLAYAGTALLDAHPPILNQAVPGLSAAMQVNAPFTLRGSADNPQFALAGSPQVVVQPNLTPASAPASLPSTINDLLKLIPMK